MLHRKHHKINKEVAKTALSHVTFTSSPSEPQTFVASCWGRGKATEEESLSEYTLCKNTKTNTWLYSHVWLLVKGDRVWQTSWLPLSHYRQKAYIQQPSQSMERGKVNG